MKAFFVLILILFTNLLSTGQIYFGPLEPETLDGQEVLTVVDTMPKFVGGEDCLRQFIQKTISDSLRKFDSFDSNVYVSIVIDKYGIIRDPKILRGKYEAQNKESLRIIKVMPRWIPGRQNGKNVYVRRIVKFDFSPKK